MLTPQDTTIPRGRKRYVSDCGTGHPNISTVQMSTKSRYLLLIHKPGEKPVQVARTSRTLFHRRGTMSHPIPAGHREITPHLVINGASEAIEFYKRAFGARELSRMPFPNPDGTMKLGHAELQIGGSRL